MPIGARRFQPWLERIQEWLHTRSNVRPQRLHAWLQRSDTPDHAVFFLSQTIVASAALTFLLCQDERGWTTSVLIATIFFPFLYLICATCCNAKPKLTQSQFYGPPRDTKGRIGVAVQILKNSGAAGLADVIATLYVVFWSAMYMDGLATAWFVAAMYGAYLVQTFGGPFFGMLLRCHLACQRGGDLHSVLRPLVVAEPYVKLHVSCSHATKRGKRSTEKVVTHRATEWVPWHAWRDTTHFPREMWLAQRSFLIDVNVVLVLDQGGEAMVADLLEQFKMNHSKDVNVCVTSEVCMARFDHTGLWSGLWDGPVSCMAGEPASLRRSLVAKYALASFFVCALPARVWIQAGCARLDVVVQKTLSMNAQERCEGWKVYPPPPLPSGSQGLRGWTFRHPMTGRDGLPRGEISELPRPTDISAFPRITVLDFVVCWLREQPWVHVSVLLAALWTSALLAAISSASCVAAWLCCMLVPLVALLEVVLVGFASTEVFMLTVMWRNIVRVLVVAVSILCTIPMIVASQSLVLLWKDRQSPSILTTVRGLTQDKLASEGIVYFADGAVDNSKVTSKRICKKISHKKNAMRKCTTYYASPILERALGMLGAVASDTAASESYLAFAWAVSANKAPEDVRCARRGGICGIAAETEFPPSWIKEFRHLIDASPIANDTSIGMVFVVDPESYLAWALHDAYGVFAVITFVSVIFFIVALYIIRRRNTCAERELLLRPNADFRDTFTERAALIDAALLS
eukprot:TRINITY_DN3015_c0_g1_i2.p1 TRINITY_DN3015_c0_g1~~TRINITY_DN3015_c0_g1_i2.p1  ORF type:complete len:764 (-),score=63.55 TRINITY_DN3015_c0_g1_i2:26-2260(-)